MAARPNTISYLPILSTWIALDLQQGRPPLQGSLRKRPSAGEELRPSLIGCYGGFASAHPHSSESHRHWFRCRPESGWNLEWRILRSHEGIVSGGKVNWLIDGFCGERLPTIDLAHVDLP